MSCCSQPQLNAFSHFHFLHFTSQYKSKAVFKTLFPLSLHCKLQIVQTYICLLGADIIWKCHCPRAGLFSGSVVRGCIQLNTTSKGPVFLWFILFHHKACAQEACREDQPFPPSYRMMDLPNSSPLGIKAKQTMYKCSFFVHAVALANSWAAPWHHSGWLQQNGLFNCYPTTVYLGNISISDDSTLHDLSPMPTLCASAGSAK